MSITYLWLFSFIMLLNRTVSLEIKWHPPHLGTGLRESWVKLVLFGHEKQDVIRSPFSLLYRGVRLRIE